MNIVYDDIDDATMQRIARRYCERMGLNPDETVAHGPQWQRAVREIKPMLALLLAVEDIKLGGG